MLIDAGERSPVGSVIGSSSSQDDLDMRPACQSVRQVSGTEARRPVSRPPTSMRGFNNIPTTSAPPQTQTASIHNQFALLTSAPAAKHANVVSANTMSARHNSSYSLFRSQPVSARGPTSAPTTPAAAPTAANQSEFPLNWVTFPGPQLHITPPTVAADPLPISETKQSRDRRTSKPPRPNIGSRA